MWIQKYGKFYRIQLGHFIKHRTLILEQCNKFLIQEFPLLQDPLMRRVEGSVIVRHHRVIEYFHKKNFHLIVYKKNPFFRNPNYYYLKYHVIVWAVYKWAQSKLASKIQLIQQLPL